MASHTGETLVGLGVVAVAAAFLGYALTLKDTRSDRDGYELHAAFGQANGVATGTDVRIAGVKVGTVSKVALDGATYMAKLTMRVQKDIKIPEDSIAKVASDGLLGGNHIAIEPGGAEDVLAAGGNFENTQGSLDLLGILGAFAGKKDAAEPDAAAADAP